MNPRYIMMGGFLGAGKTTAVARLAGHYLAQGKRVGIVTNDQTTGLVDTHALKELGFNVGEVAGSCFCCNFDALTATVESLEPNALPEVILAEPVGSCTDLVATVIRPLVQVYDRELDLAPYGVIVKPSHGLRILRGEAHGGFSPQAEYIFRKQIEEADFVIINRVDQLAPSQVQELRELLESEYPGRIVLAISARTGQGFPQLIEVLEGQGACGRQVMDVDYDVYAQGEAELGWLNGQVQLESQRGIELDTFLMALMHRLHARLVADNAESAHLKAIAMSDTSYAVANVVSNATGPELSLGSHATAPRVDLIINARVATDPERLEQYVRDEIAAVGEPMGVDWRVVSMQSFRPGRPVPTHRIAS